MKYVYKLAFILVIGSAFALAQTGAGQSSPSTSPSQQPGAQQTPESSPMGQSGSAGSAAKAQSDIQTALHKQLPASADNVTVSVGDNNKIQLSGNVSSDTEKQQVEQIARSAAPGVDIDNKLTVSSSPSAPGSTPPSGSKPPLRLVAYQSSSSPQSSPAAQEPSKPSSDQAGSMSQASQAGGSDVQDKIQKAIQQDSSLSGANITVAVAGDKVELTGTVASKDQKKTAQQIAESNAGGMKVVNHLKVAGSESSPSAPPKN